MTEANSNEILIQVQATPNPNAWKFVLDRPVIAEDKATFSNADEAYGNRLALDLITIDGVKQVHFFSNVVTITHRIDAEEEKLKQEVCAVIQSRLPVHDPRFGKKDAKKAKRATLSEELQQIEEILDRTIRPGLQGDGGDIEVIKFDENKLYVNYQGACGTCPSSTSGTLMAIEGILRDEYDANIEVIPI